VRLNPSNPNSQALLQQMETDLEQAERAVAANPSAENDLYLPLRYHEAGRYADCIRTAREALGQRPGKWARPELAQE